MKCLTLKLLDLNPNVPEEQMQDLICEKLSQYGDFTVRIAQHDKSRIAYIEFKKEADAQMALKKESCIALFGYACRAVPVYTTGRYNLTATIDKPPNKSADVKVPLLKTPKSLLETPKTLLETPKEAEMKGEATVKQESSKPVSEKPDNDKESPDRESSPPSRGRGRGRGRGRAGFRGARARGGRGSLTRGGKSKPYMLESGDSIEEEQHPNSTLYIGSLDSVVRITDLKRLFKRFGFVLDVDIKTPDNKNRYAFVRFLNMDMARLARQEMAGKPIGRTVPVLGYGAPMQSRSVWVGGLGPWTSVDMLRLEFSQFGEIETVLWPENRDYAYIEFGCLEDAAETVSVMHGSRHGDPPHRLRVTFATADQVNSDYNYLGEFPKFPTYPTHVPHKTEFYIPGDRDRDSTERESRGSRRWGSPESRRSDSRERRSYESREFRRDFRNIRHDSREFHRRRSPDSPPRRRSPDSPLPRRRLSHSPPRKRSPPRKTSGQRASHSYMKLNRRKRSVSPYAGIISREYDEDMSSISDELSRSDSASPVRSKRHKRHRRSSSHSRSPAALMRNPSPPPAGSMRDERTVILRSEPSKVSSVLSVGYTSTVNPLQTVTMPQPQYVQQVDPVTYYPSANPVSAQIFPPPLHLPPPNFTLPPPNPVMPQYNPLTMPAAASSYPALSTDLQPVPAATYTPATEADSKQSQQTAVTAANVPAQKAPCEDVARKFPKVWSGALVLRNAAFVVDLHLVSGSVLLVSSQLGGNVEPGSVADCPVLKIAQRLRLDQPDKLDELDRRLKKAGRAGCSVLLAISAVAQVDDDANVVQQYPLNNLVSYLLQKQVAAVVPLPANCADGAKATGILHAFPPCQFANSLLHSEAPGLPDNCITEEQLLVVLCDS